MEYLEIKDTYVRLGSSVNSVLYEPVIAVEKSKIAILVMHSDEDYLTFSINREMAKRGYRVLAASVSDKSMSLDNKILEAKLAVEYLRAYDGVEKVILMGHSGGATLMSAYQALAENGVEIFQDDEKLIKVSDDLAGLPGADGVMLLDSNWGNGAMSLFCIDPAVVDETNSQLLDPELNLFNPDNGFIPGGSIYSDEFVERFFRGQRDRSNRLIDTALGRRDLIERGDGNYIDDEPYVVSGMAQSRFNNKLYPQDIRFFAHTRGEYPLLRGDGSATIEVVYSLRRPTNDESFTDSLEGGALITTVRNFLTNSAVRTTEGYGFNEDSVFGIDWSSSYNCPPGNIRYVTVPLLAMGMTASWEYLAAEMIFENAASTDKTIAFVEGADHLFETATELEESPGQFGDTLKTTCDFVDSWISEAGRFLD